MKLDYCNIDGVVKSPIYCVASGRPMLYVPYFVLSHL